MKRRPGPDDVQLMLTYAKDASGEVVRVDLEAAHADTGEQLFRTRMSPATFTRLIASGVTVVRSSVAVPRAGNEPDCQDDNPNVTGDCDGRVREYTVTGDNVCGRLRGESVLLCASHASHHGRNIRRVSLVGGRG